MDESHDVGDEGQGRRRSDAGSPPREASNKPWFGGRGIELLIGLSVALVSVVSLFVAVSANRTQEGMLAASVWPSLQFGTSNVSSEGAPQITFDLLNRGIGPARMRWAEVSFDGTPVRSFSELLQRCCNFVGESPGLSSGLQRRVLSSDEWVHVVLVPRQAVSDSLWEALDRGRQKVRLRTCYCSVLDDCWMFDSDAQDAEPVRKCPAAPEVLWGR